MPSFLVLVAPLLWAILVCGVLVMLLRRAPESMIDAEWKNIGAYVILAAFVLWALFFWLPKVWPSLVR